MPAKMVHSAVHSLVGNTAGGGAGGAGTGGAPAKKRMSVASVQSFDSLPEELERELELDSEDITPAPAVLHALENARPGAPAMTVRGRMGMRNASPPPPWTRRSTSSVPSLLSPRPVMKQQQRYSLPPPLPPGAYPYQSLALPVGNAPLTAMGRTSPLGKSMFGLGIAEAGARDTDSTGESARMVEERKRREEKLADRQRRRTSAELGGEERAKREARRWRIALELRDTERSYVDVLAEIDEVRLQVLGLPRAC